MQAGENHLMNYSITVITVCYNAADILPMTLESVLAQDYDDFEYVIQDGDSTDDTPDVIAAYKEKFEAKNIPFRYNRERDGGIYDAMNKAVTFANGDFINFMNAGDCFYSSDVLRIVSRAIKDPAPAGTSAAGIIFGDCAVYEFGRFFKYQKSPEEIETKMPFSHQSVFARSDLLRANPFDTGYRFSADYDFLLTMHDLGVGFVDAGTVICITTADGLSSVKYHDTLMETARIQEAHGVLRQSRSQLARTERILRLKQFVLDHFPLSIKKWIRDRQISSRGQTISVVTPPWFNDLAGASRAPQSK